MGEWGGKLVILVKDMRKNLIENVEGGLAYSLVGMHTGVHAEEKEGRGGRAITLVLCGTESADTCTMYIEKGYM